MAGKKKSKSGSVGKQQSIADIYDVIEKKYGQGSVTFLDEGVVQNLKVVSTGSIALDFALGVMGLPRGRVVEILGPESSGKTTICIHVIANAQALGLKCAFIDAEHAFDPEYAENLKVLLTGENKLLFSQPDCGEDALSIAEDCVKAGIDVLVIDSVAALTPRAEIEGQMGDSHVGLQARLMSQALRKLVGLVKKNDVLLIFTNQIRHKIGVTFGSPETTSGGNALKFYASVRLDIRRIGSEQDKDGNRVSNNVRVKVIKNKVGPPFKQAETEILFGEGFNYYGEVLDLAMEEGHIKKRGAWFSYGEENIGQGREAALEVLKSNNKFTKELLDMMLKQRTLIAKLEKLRKKFRSEEDKEEKSKLKKQIKELKKEIENV